MKISKWDLKYINDNGIFLDINTGKRYRLRDETIIGLRKHFGYKVAKNRRILTPREEQITHNKRIAKGKLQKDNKYTGHRYKGVRFKNKKVIVGSIAVALSLFLITPISNELGYGSTFQSDAGFYEEYDMTDRGDVVKVVDVSQPLENVDVLSIESVGRDSFIDYICSVYQVDPRVVHQKLRELTDNYSNMNYLDGRIEGVTTKGVDLDASSEEEALICAIRAFSQLPENFGIENIDYNLEFRPGASERDAIVKYADIFGIDPNMLYSVVQLETGFSSNLYNNNNNPVGIRGFDGDEWQSFPTKDAGYIEACLEFRKYYRMVGADPLDVSRDTLEKIFQIHAPASDGNEGYVDELIEIMADNSMKVSNSRVI